MIEIRDASHQFGPLPVDAGMAGSLDAMGYREPTPIQEESIPPLRAGRDVLAQAQTGTGKTAGFGIPLIETIDPHRKDVQALVLVPTRELCLQVAEELAALSAHTGTTVVAVYGGVSLNRQISDLRRGAPVVVGTPGRVEDLLHRGDLRLDAVRLAVLDEADRMLDIGFLPVIERILSRTPRARQTALFSATIPDDIKGLAHRQMRDPVTVRVAPEGTAAEDIEQRFQRVAEDERLPALQAYLDTPSCYLALVFRRTTYKADQLAKKLTKAGYKVAALHGRRTQGQRERALADLRSGKLQALIATDIAARGLDITGLTHVFNYDLPDTPETYLHRIGRTGRAGQAGIAVTLVGPDDEDAVRAIKRYLAGKKGKVEAQNTPSPLHHGRRNGQPASTASRPVNEGRSSRRHLGRGRPQR